MKYGGDDGGVGAAAAAGELRLMAVEVADADGGEEEEAGLLRRIVVPFPPFWILFVRSGEPEPELEVEVEVEVG